MTVIAVAVGLGGCSFLNEAVWPSLTGAPPPDPAQAPTATEPEQTPPPPVTDMAGLATALDAIDTRMSALVTRIPQVQIRLEDVRTSLGEQAQLVENPPQLPEQTQFDQWASAQIELSRLSDDLDILTELHTEVAVDAATATTALKDLQSYRPTREMGEEALARYTESARFAENALVQIGTMNETVTAEKARWQAYLQAQSERIGANQRGQIIEPGEVGPQVDTRPRQADDYPDSADRFKGRKPLASLNFADPELAFREELDDLLRRVQAQYPDIAFDIEVIGATKQQVRDVLAVLRAYEIAAQPYRTLRLPDEDPAIKLYPR